LFSNHELTFLFFSLLLPLAAPFLIVAASATTVLDPLPEHSTPHFGQTLVTLGDINGDSVPDVAVAAFPGRRFPFDRSFLWKTANFVLDGSNLSVLEELNDPEFEQIQPQHFGGQLASAVML
jgi:hypothetical protein